MKLEEIIGDRVMDKCKGVLTNIKWSHFPIRNVSNSKSYIKLPEPRFKTN